MDLLTAEFLAKPHRPSAFSNIYVAWLGEESIGRPAIHVPPMQADALSELFIIVV
jgi:hypothetical protein